MNPSTSYTLSAIIGVIAIVMTILYFTSKNCGLKNCSKQDQQNEIGKYIESLSADQEQEFGRSLIYNETWINKLFEAKPELLAAIAEDPLVKSKC
jgi:hypothetical protein